VSSQLRITDGWDQRGEAVEAERGEEAKARGEPKEETEADGLRPAKKTL
jgi:hypothetical protein